jgi:hypothetical protein
MSTFAALKMSCAPLAIMPKQGTKRGRNDGDDEAYPMFVGAEKEALINLRRETWKYRPYLGMEKMYEIHDKEATVVTQALEEGANPYDAAVNYWRSNIDMGKNFMLRSLAINKVWIYALQLVSAGLMNHAQITHYIDLASDLKMNSVETSIRRLEDVTEEFIKALAEKRVACMCKEVKCYCLP